MKNYFEIEQEYIPVGCILPAHWPYLVVLPCMPPHHRHPLPCMPPGTHIPLAMHAPCHSHPPTMHAPCHAHPLPCMPPVMHTTPAMHTPHTNPLQWMTPAMHIPPAMHAPPCRQNSWHMLLKILPCPNFVAGGNKANEIFKTRDFLKNWTWFYPEKRISGIKS